MFEKLIFYAQSVFAVLAAGDFPNFVVILMTDKKN